MHDCLDDYFDWILFFCLLQRNWYCHIENARSMQWLPKLICHSKIWHWKYVDALCTWGEGYLILVYFIFVSSCLVRNIFYTPLVQLWLASIFDIIARLTDIAFVSWYFMLAVSFIWYPRCPSSIFHICMLHAWWKYWAGIHSSWNGMTFCFFLDNRNRRTLHLYDWDWILSLWLRNFGFATSLPLYNSQLLLAPYSQILVVCKTICHFSCFTENSGLNATCSSWLDNKNVSSDGA